MHLGGAHDDVIDDQQSIRHTINSIYNTPERRVGISPVVVQGDHAIASWIQQDKGGRPLLHRNSKGTWAIVLCAGKAVKEVKLDKETISLFDSFKGAIRNTHKPAHHRDEEHTPHESSSSHHPH